jgi:hypothetical protein
VGNSSGASLGEKLIIIHRPVAGKSKIFFRFFLEKKQMIYIMLWSGARIP